MWRVLSHTFKDKAAFSMSRSKDKISDLISDLGVSLGSTDKSKIVYWAPGSSEPTVYDGVTKYEPLTKFVQSLLDGSARTKEEL
ncbi:hypothetical protein FRC16_009087 [Serendipita sp. 398]|nr:hypothetical protein FRC16_009087 [Serendipita sp. 398]